MLKDLITSRLTPQKMLKRSHSGKKENNARWKYGLYQGTDNIRNDNYMD
jgi:hypothetical protein